MTNVAKIAAYKNDLERELDNILNYWLTTTIDTVNGGFFGKISDNNQVDAYAPKGVVLNSRILWTFSAAYNFTKNKEYQAPAHRACQYITEHFIDHEFGGVYWTVNYKGEKLDTKKQVYGTAFTIYGLSEYYMATGISDAKDLAIKLYRTLVDKCYDKEQTGYLEAFSADWKLTDDLRLSAKDANEKKTMNTHLHVLEAFANLYKIWPDKGLETQLRTLLDNFSQHFINDQTGHLNLFFDENWNKKSDMISYGHDIEAAWLLLEAAEILGDKALATAFKKNGLLMASSTISVLDSDNGLWYEFEPASNHLVKEKHWWVQAEAMVGFYNAWEISDNDKYLDVSLKNWSFVKSKILNKQYGEWHWGIGPEGQVMAGEDKAGLWKCPYHNSRACMEIIKRITKKLN
jgi:mannobiose 2-epimerase